MGKYWVVAVLVALTVTSATSLVAESRSAVPCPAVIADNADGTYRRIVPGGSGRNQYQCFRKPADARKKGYITPQILLRQDFSGWWRLRLKTTKDSCAGQAGASGPVLFMQVSQNDDAVFADFCPSLGRQSGVRTETGFTTQHIELVQEFSNPLGCDGGIVERVQSLEFSRILKGDLRYAARLVIVRRCPGESEGALSCSTEFSGVGFPETHKIWPAVETNISVMKNGCSAALARCVDCHENLRDLPSLNP